MANIKTVFGEMKKGKFGYVINGQLFHNPEDTFYNMAFVSMQVAVTRNAAFRAMAENGTLKASVIELV
jgi:hypothetical protein